MIEECVLIERAKNGETSAFRELVERNKKNVYYLALDLTGNHHDAEDLSQEVFIKAYRNIKDFRSDSKLSSWLYRITVNTNINQYRKKSHRERKTHESLDELSPSQQHVFSKNGVQNPEKIAEAGLMQSHIDGALDRLTAKERSIFVLRHYSDLPLKEIAEIHDVQIGTVKSMLFRTIQKLQKELSFYKEDFGWGNSHA